jgi:hypothetical protein
VSGKETIWGSLVRPSHAMESRNGIERIEVDPHDHFQIGGRKRRDVYESVHRPLPNAFRASMFADCFRVMSTEISG